MTVSTTAAGVSYTGDGLQVAFTVSFPFGTGSDLKVYLISGGVPVLQTLGADYTVAGGSGTTGTITFGGAPGSGVEVRIARSTSLTQQVSLRDPGKFPARTIETALDRIWFAIQEQAARTGGSDFDLGATIGTMKIDSSDLTRFDALAKRIGNLAAPSAGSDAVTKDYADALTIGAGNLPTPGAAQQNMVLVVLEDQPGDPVSVTGYQFYLRELQASQIGGLGTAAVVDIGTAENEIPALGAGGVLAVGRIPTGTAENTVPILGPGGLLAPSTIPAASETEMNTGTDTQKPVTAGRLAHHPLTPAAWGLLNQTGTQALVASKGVASITDLGTGITRVTLSAAMADANYAVLVTGPDNTFGGVASRTTTTFEVRMRTSAVGPADSDGVSFAVIGARAAS
jgi:hypothetical protein